MPGQTDIRWKIVESALALAAREGWPRVTLAAVAREAGQPLSVVAAEFPSKQAILTALNRHVDAEMLKDEIADDGSVKDRLFELLMRRLDALFPYRDGVRAALRGTVGVDPLASLAGLCALQRSMSLALEAAGVSSSGPLGQLQANALGTIYLRALGLWLRDSDGSNDRVMAELDKMLTRAERFARSFTPPHRRRDRPADEAPPVESPG